MCADISAAIQATDYPPRRFAPTSARASTPPSPRSSPLAKSPPRRLRNVSPGQCYGEYCCSRGRKGPRFGVCNYGREVTLLNGVLHPLDQGLEVSPNSGSSSSENDLEQGHAQLSNSSDVREEDSPRQAGVDVALEERGRPNAKATRSCTSLIEKLRIPSETATEPRLAQDQSRDSAATSSYTDLSVQALPKTLSEEEDVMSFTVYDSSPHIDFPIGPLGPQFVARSTGQPQALSHASITTVVDYDPSPCIAEDRSITQARHTKQSSRTDDVDMETRTISQGAHTVTTTRRKRKLGELAD